jgi:hypothetical protein
VSELGDLDRQGEGGLDQGLTQVGVEFLVSATDLRQCLACGRWTGQVAKRSGLRKEGHNTGRDGNEWNCVLGTGL